MKKVYKSNYLKNISKMLSIILLIVTALFLIVLFYSIIVIIINAFLFIVEEKVKIFDKKAETDYLINIFSSLSEFVILCLLNHTFKFKNLIYNSYIKICRYIYCKMHIIFKKSHIKNIFIYDYSLNNNPLECQDKIITTFFLNKYKNKALYILGDRYSGKTSILYLIMDKGIKENVENFLFFNNKVIYICKNSDEKQLNLFESKYNLKSYKNDIIFIDDYSELSEITKIMIKR